MHYRALRTAGGRRTLWWVPLLVLSAGGCSGGTPEDLYPVTGTVRVGEQLLTGGGTIYFEMMDVGNSGKRYTSTSVVDEQGRFRLITFGEDGAPACKHRVWVIPDFARMPDKIGVNPTALSPIPRKYMMPTTTDLEVEVKPEENDLKIVVPAEE